MLESFQFSEDKINQILLLAQKNIKKMDDAASAFIDAVNELLGENVYHLDSIQKS
jgi:ABC-type proline/glycine betaine transport system substrate-binding protein